MPFLLLLVACAVVPYQKPLVVSPVPPEPVATLSVDLAPLLKRVDSALASTTETDTRDRLVELRELLLSVQVGSPAAQEAVLRYAGRVLAIEERSRPFTMAESPMEMASAFDTVTEEVVPEPVDALAPARAALSAGKPLDAVAVVDAALAANPNLPGAAELRAAAADAWAHDEREAAGAAFLAARALPAGADRSAALQAVATRLAAINERFPQNRYAADVAQNLAIVQKELTP